MRDKRRQRLSWRSKRANHGKMGCKGRRVGRYK